MILPKTILDVPRARLPQPARLAAAALARRRADPAGHHGRRRGDRGRRHEDGGRARYRAGGDGGARVDRPRHDGRRAARPPRAASAPTSWCAPSRRLSRGALSFTPQSADGVTYAHKIANAEARIDWDKPAGAVHNHVRGLSPFPGRVLHGGFRQGRGAGQGAAHAAGGRRCGRAGALLDQRGTVACGVGAVRLALVQRAGRPPVAAEDFLRGARLPAGILLTGAAAP